ncbi:Uncharacterised protein [Mycobacteroides abscessus subsp. abscessus]|nr:Uncharacterised protein [Mycobacteroides abscessus subsp. abscessus]SHV31241.1 Uncharacterised protein [Mycobacteroides abscessus subsp. abscessus]
MDTRDTWTRQLSRRRVLSTSATDYRKDSDGPYPDTIPGCRGPLPPRQPLRIHPAGPPTRTRGRCACDRDHGNGPVSLRSSRQWRPGRQEIVRALLGTGRGTDGRRGGRVISLLFHLWQFTFGEGRDDGSSRWVRRRVTGRARQPQVDHRRLDLLRRAAALDHTAMGRPAAYLPSALSAPGRGGMAAAPGCGRRLDRQPQPLWHLCGYRGHCAGMSSSR